MIQVFAQERKLGDAPDPRAVSAETCGGADDLMPTKQVFNRNAVEVCGARVQPRVRRRAHRDVLPFVPDVVLKFGEPVSADPALFYE
jgi:hypothetical protein